MVPWWHSRPIFLSTLPPHTALYWFRRVVCLHFLDHDRAAKAFCVDVGFEFHFSSLGPKFEQHPCSHLVLGCRGVRCLFWELETGTERKKGQLGRGLALVELREEQYRQQQPGSPAGHSFPSGVHPPLLLPGFLKATGLAY